MSFSNGGPDRIRTGDLLIANEALFPAVLQARICDHKKNLDY
jgi:hypothetical protein